MLSTRVPIADDSSQTETRILSAVCAVKQCGCVAAWRILLSHYQPMCRRIARGMLPQGYLSWVDDVAQQSLMIIYRKLDTWQGSDKSSLDAWVRRIVYRESLRMIWQIRRWEVSVDGPSLAVHDVANDDQSLQSVETWDEVVGFRHTLCSTHHRRVLMHLVQGDHPTSIASALGLPSSTVRRTIDAVRERFRRFWEQ